MKWCEFEKFIKEQDIPKRRISTLFSMPDYYIGNLMKENYELEIDDDMYQMLLTIVDYELKNRKKESDFLEAMRKQRLEYEAARRTVDDKWINSILADVDRFSMLNELIYG